MVSLSPALTSEARLCAAVGSQLPADPPKLQSTVSQLPSIEAVRRLLSGGHRHRSWAAALAAARHTWAELRRRWQLSEPFYESALPLPGGGGGRCLPMPARVARSSRQHASACTSCLCCDCHRPACATHRRPVRLLPLLCAACGCALRSRRGSRLLSDWIRGFRAGFGGAQCLQLTGH